MHAILVIPGLAWLLTFTRWPERRRLRVVQLGVAGYGLLTAAALVESATHVSPLAAPALGIVVSTAGLAAVIMAGAVALYGLLRPARS
jgi:hypothetical protein